jgi:hypothetical protein
MTLETNFQNIHTKVHKDWFRHSKVNKEGFTDTDNMEVA